MRRFQKPPPAPSRQAALLGVDQGPFCGHTCPRGSVWVCRRRLLGLWGPQPLISGYPGQFNLFCCRVDAVRPCAGWGAHAGDLPGRGQTCGWPVLLGSQLSTSPPGSLLQKEGSEAGSLLSPTPRRSSV